VWVPWGEMTWRERIPLVGFVLLCAVFVGAVRSPVATVVLGGSCLLSGVLGLTIMRAAKRQSDPERTESSLASKYDRLSARRRHRLSEKGVDRSAYVRNSMEKGDRSASLMSKSFKVFSGIGCALLIVALVLAAVG